MFKIILLGDMVKEVSWEEDGGISLVFYIIKRFIRRDKISK